MSDAKRLERLIVGALYLSLASLGQMALLSEPSCLAGLIVIVMLLQISVGHLYSFLNRAKITFMLMGWSLPPTSFVLPKPIRLEMTATLAEELVVTETGTSSTLFQFGCLLTQSGSEASPAALFLLNSVIRLPMLENV